MQAFQTVEDIINRALQHLQLPRVGSQNNFSQAAVEMKFAYNKVRQAELERNLWTFATRRQRLRAVSHSTQLVKPLLWNATTAYPAAAVVAYPLATYWVSRAPSTGVTPSITAVDVFGDPLWDSYYGPLTACPWQTISGNPNPNAEPGYPGSPEFDSTLGPQPNQSFSVPGFDSGELAFLPVGNGTATLFQCLHATDDYPLEVELWSSTRYYNKGQVVGWPSTPTFVLGPNGDTLSDSSTLGNLTYQSTSNLNFGNDPQLTQLDGGAPAWNINTQWTPTEYAYGSDNQIYLCIANSIGNNPDAYPVSGAGSNPVTDYANAFWQPLSMYMGMWTALATNPGSLNSNWQQTAATLVPITIPWSRGGQNGYPTGFGPSEERSTGNVFRLPAGWIRRAPENPKDAAATWLGGPTGIPWPDYTFEGDWVLSASCGAFAGGNTIVLRFVADVQDVVSFHPMFCEALALQLAIGAAGSVNALDRLQACLVLYQRVVQDARTVDAVEAGETLDNDDGPYVTCRI